MTNQNYLAQTLTFYIFKKVAKIKRIKLKKRKVTKRLINFLISVFKANKASKVKMQISFYRDLPQ